MVVDDGGITTVSLCDGAHDSETKSGSSPCAGVVSPSEAVKGPSRDVGWEPRALVGYFELDAGARAPRSKQDLTGAVAQRVVHEVAEGLAETERVGAQLLTVVNFQADAAAVLLGAVDEPLANAFEQRTDGNGLL